MSAASRDVPVVDEKQRWHHVGGVSCNGYTAHLRAPDGALYSISRLDPLLHSDGNSPAAVAEVEATLGAVQRLVGCANACAGIPQAALEAGELIGALQASASTIRDLRDGYPWKELHEPVDDTLARFDRLGFVDESPECVAEEAAEDMRP